MTEGEPNKYDNSFISTSWWLDIMRTQFRETLVIFCLILLCKCAQICPLCISFVFPPPHPAAVQQVSSPSVFSFCFLPPCLAGSLVLTIKKAANLAGRRHNCHYDCCGPAHHTLYWLFHWGGGGKHCLLCADATQYYHSVTTAHPQTYTHTQSLSHSFQPSQSPCNLSIKHRTNISFYRAENPYTTAF